MKDSENRFEDFFFFLCKVFIVALVAIMLYLARDWYERKQIDDSVDFLIESFIK